MENLTNKNKKDCTKQEPDTLKKSEDVTNDDKKSKITAPTTPVHMTSTPAKASEQRSRLSPTRHSDKPKPLTSVGVANQLTSLKRLATNPIREDQTSKLDYLKIQEDIA